MSTRRRLVLPMTASMVALGIGVGTASSSAEQATGKVLLSEDFEAHTPGRAWADGRSYGRWQAVYNGYGKTAVGADRTGRHLSLSPRRAKTLKHTHAGLVTTAQVFRDLDVSVRVRTVSQHRATPNTWEVPWLLWHYRDDEHFYSVILKPNGWELGKEDPAYPGAQRYLRTGGSPRFALNREHTVRVRQQGSRITVWANGRLLTTFVDRERPYGSGRVGLYSEDARVTFDNVVVRRP